MSNEINKIYDPVEIDADFFAENEDEQERFYSIVKTLPDLVLDVLFGLDTPKILEGIARNFGLQPEQSAILSRLVRKVLIGDFYIGDFPSKISSGLDVDQDKAREIAKATASDLFIDAVADIKRIHLQKFPNASLEKQPEDTKGQQHGVKNLSETGGNIIDLRSRN
ncbi:MAG: hypothetical protein WD898_03660 [Candidatus Paceibacterota bacterium]